MCKIQDKYKYKKNVILPKPDDTLLNGIPESVPDYIKEHQKEEGHPDLDDMLYRHVKQMLCDHTIYALCTQVSDDCTNVSKVSQITWLPFHQEINGTLLV